MGGGSNDAQRDAERAERERLAAIQGTQRQIDAVFSSPTRERDIADFGAAQRQYYRKDADRQQADAARNTRFALARSGLTGGQFDADTNARLGETYQRGLLDADRRAQAAVAGLRAADQDAKQRLFSMAQSGLDATTAMNQSAQLLRQNLDSSRADSGEKALGDLFSRFGDIYTNSIKQDEERKSQKYIYPSFYQPSPYAGGRGGGI
jgi:hypothetical protein